MNKPSMNKFRQNAWILRSLLLTIWFNFRHLPVRHAIKLPILLYKPHLRHNSGKFIINGDVRFGMIRLGAPSVSIFPNSGIVIENRGTVIFDGKCFMGNDCAITTGEKGILRIGNGFHASAGAKIICYHSIKFSSDVRIGWKTMILDTDFHSMKSIDGTKRTKGYGPIEIGQNCWIASFCKILKNTAIPPYCTVASGTLLNRRIESGPYNLIYNPSEIKAKPIDMWRDFTDDMIDYES